MFAFGDPRPEACRRCSKPLTPVDFEFDRAMVLLGRPYCSRCLKDFLRSCHGCRKQLRQSDFDCGRAVTLGNDLYCDDCVEIALQTARPAAILPPSALEALANRRREEAGLPPERPAAPPSREPADGWASRRSSARFIPPQDCALKVRPAGLKGVLRGNALRLWVDVSEGGLRAVLAGVYAQGDAIQGKFIHPSRKGNLQFRGQVRHSRPSEKYPGCMLVGLKFESPSAQLVSFIRDILGRDVAAVSVKPRPSNQPPPARTA